MSRRGKRVRRVHVKPCRAQDALMVSGLFGLVSLAMGASPDKALDYGISALRLFGAKIEYEEEPESDFMVGLA